MTCIEKEPPYLLLDTEALFLGCNEISRVFCRDQNVRIFAIGSGLRRGSALTVPSRVTAESVRQVIFEG